MATYSPTVVISSTPGLSVRVAGLTYSQFIQALTSNFFLLKKIFLSANSIDQINQVISYTIIDAEGNQITEQLVVSADPNQAMPAISIKIPFKMLLNGLSTITFNVLPGEQIQLIMYAEQEAMADDLDKFSVSNFKRVDDKLGNLALYKRQQKQKADK